MIFFCDWYRLVSNVFGPIVPKTWFHICVLAKQLKVFRNIIWEQLPTIGGRGSQSLNIIFEKKIESNLRSTYYIGYGSSWYVLGNEKLSLQGQKAVQIRPSQPKSCTSIREKSAKIFNAKLV